MKNDKSSKIALLLEVALLAMFIISMAFVIVLAVIDMDDTKQIGDAKARCESAGGKLGHLKCYKDGREI